MATAASGRPWRRTHGLPPPSCKKWKNTKQTFAVGAWRFTGTKRSWKDITASLLSACSGTSMLLKCDFLRAIDIPNGSFGFLHRSLLWAEKSLASQAKNPLRPSKKKPFIPNPQLLITDLLAFAKKWHPSDTAVRYLYQPGELEGGGKRATDPIWSLKV